jgi:serine/threonine protein kinase
MANEYHCKNIFHGDIKPENIFYQEKYYFSMTTDVGSLLYLGDPDENE